MKKQLFLGLAAGLFSLVGCQNELYIDPAEEFSSPQSLYISNEEAVQIFVAEGQDVLVKNLKVALSNRVNEEVKVTLELGNEAQLEAYNKRNNTQYLLLPKGMYKATQNLVFKSEATELQIPLELANVKFSQQGDYALPVRIVKGGANVLKGKDECLLVLEKRIRTKSIRFNGSGAEDGAMFPDDYKVNQWTMEAMVNRASYNTNNRSIAGTKLVANAGPMDEIYTRFGDVTIEPNQLQIKTGASQIDIEKSKFAAQPDEWYMLTFSYDGHKNYVYVNGELVADREIRTGAYGLTGFWIGGSNELIREVRFWSVCRTQQEIKDYTWKMVNPDEEGLLLYYPLNGKRFDRSTGQPVEDETRIWDWAQGEHHLDIPRSASFDDNGGEYFIFPKED